MLLFMMSHLRRSPHPDIVFVSRRFLPVDMNATAEETALAYRMLYERQFIERVDGLAPGNSDRLALRIVVQGLNDRKHTAPYREETFGFPGARIDGKMTIGNIIALVPSLFAQRALKAWPPATDDEPTTLQQWLQDAVGEKRAYVEKSKIVSRTGDETIVQVTLRCPIDESDLDLEGVLHPAAEAWIRQHVAGFVADRN